MINIMRRKPSYIYIYNRLKKIVSSAHTLRVLSAALCAVLIFGLAAPAGAVSAYAEEPAACTGEADCAADIHNDGCLSQGGAKETEGQSGAPVTVCSKADDCAAETHEEDCPKYKAPSGGDNGENKAAEPAQSSENVCTGLSDCKAETHNEGCLSQKQENGGNNAGDSEVWSDGTLTASIDGVSVSLTGPAPTGAQLRITKAEGGTDGTDGSFSHTYTLSIVTLEGEAEKPADASGKSYKITVTAPDSSEFETFTVKAGEADIAVNLDAGSASFALTGLGELAVSGKLIQTAKNAANVAKIVSTSIEYATLDEAVAAAADGDTIQLLASCETAGLNLSKSLTIDGGEKTRYTVSFSDKGIALWGKALSFNNCSVVMTGIGSTPYTAEWNWQAICASTGASLTLNNTTMSMDGTNAGNAHAIYFCSNNKLNLNNSSLSITNYPQDALEWDGGDGGYNVNLINSTFTSDHNRSGFTGTFTAKIDNSKVSVINSTGNGSNGSHFEIVNGAIVDFSSNGAHGLSAGKLTIDNSTVTANNNGANGIHVGSTLSISNGSNVTIQGNGCSLSSKWTIPGALYIAGESTITGSTVTITGNSGSGIYQKAGTLTIDPSANVTITNNTAVKLGLGGGINAHGTSVSLPANLVLYNNHASTAGDDIYTEGASLTLSTPAKGRGWSLDGTADTNDCAKAIDGWYDDAAGNRWTAHDISLLHVTEVQPGTLAAPVALKAAHGILTRDEYAAAEISFYKLDSVTSAPIAGAEFTAYSDAACLKSIGSAVSDKDGFVSFALTPDSYPFTFYIKETKAPDGYFALSDVFTAVLTEGEALDAQHRLVDGEVTSVTVHQPGQIEFKSGSENLAVLDDGVIAVLNDACVTLTVNKVWVTKGYSHPQSVRVNLLANGKVYGDTLILTARNDWSATVTVPMYDANGKEINYSIEEVSRIANYKPSYDGLTVYNTYTPGYIPKTGDESNLGLWLGIMSACAVCTGGVLVLLKKRKQEN